MASIVAEQEGRESKGSVAESDVTSVYQTDVTSAAPTDTLCLCSNVSVGPANIKSVWATDVTSVASGRRKTFLLSVIIDEAYLNNINLRVVAASGIAA
ncbi:hypothetical protein PCANC_17686 [Puccinia coronata f. sp. avenae]|uniref:Uncharacterized protein n=1 Tax=Puccinia coronata f. sp. avenae TaxID=200324 RepID=A0A2N5U970_9BASI|nr:hypothetical protein PCANC_17686 [Puccinia coronata f. sp. avenae]